MAKTIKKYLTSLVMIISPFLKVGSMGVYAEHKTTTGFFSNPEVISSRDILEQRDSKSLDMCWQFGEENFFRFISKKDEVYFEIQLVHIPSSYKKSNKSHFIENQGKKCFVFSYEWRNGEESIINEPRERNKESDAISPFYLVDQRRVFEHSTPKQIDESEIESIVTHQNVLFYTGAGLSVASNIPSMNELFDLLNLKGGAEFFLSLEQAIENPEDFAKKIMTFHKACFFSPATKAHEALAKLALFKNMKIVTENLDSLHEYSGILPYRINAEEIRGVDSIHLSHIDYIICVGLSHDDRGFLGYYKRTHPEGRIISIDLGNPSYLGDEDFLIQRDLQTLLPALAARIVENK